MATVQTRDRVLPRHRASELRSSASVDGHRLRLTLICDSELADVRRATDRRPTFYPVLPLGIVRLDNLCVEPELDGVLCSGTTAVVVSFAVTTDAPKAGYLRRERTYLLNLSTLSLISNICSWTLTDVQSNSRESDPERYHGAPSGAQFNSDSPVNHLRYNRANAYLIRPYHTRQCSEKILFVTKSNTGQTGICQRTSAR